MSLCRWVSGCRCFERPSSSSGFFVDCMHLKMTALGSFETSRTAHPTSQRHTTEDLNPLPSCIKNWFKDAVRFGD